MNSIKKWLYKPKKTDNSLLAQFYFADEELNLVAAELDSFDSRKDPERCTMLVAQLRACQDKVLNIIQRIMAEAIPFARTGRDFRVKFPDDVVQENLAGQLWFGAECLAAGSSIMNREIESACMRPLARALTKNLDSLRCNLREHCFSNFSDYNERIRESLVIFDKLFAEFELSYVSAMVPVKSAKEYETIQEITVLFSETVIRAKHLGYISTDMIDEYDPALMFTIPRLAIVSGLLIYPDGPLNPESPSWNMSDMFRPFQTLLFKIRELLYTLSKTELLTLERALCSLEEPEYLSSISPQQHTLITALTFTTSDIAVQTEEFSAMPDNSAEDSQFSSVAQCGKELPLQDRVSQETEMASNINDGNCSQVITVNEITSFDSIVCHLQEDATESTVDVVNRSKHLNKCDSNDSGLQSDVVSNSGSLYTLSSSDSHQMLSHFAMVSPQQSPSCEKVSALEDDLHMEYESTSLATMDHQAPVLLQVDSTATSVPSSNCDSATANKDFFPPDLHDDSATHQARCSMISSSQHNEPTERGFTSCTDMETKEIGPCADEVRDRVTLQADFGVSSLASGITIPEDENRRTVFDELENSCVNTCESEVRLHDSVDCVEDDTANFTDIQTTDSHSFDITFQSGSEETRRYPLQDIYGILQTVHSFFVPGQSDTSNIVHTQAETVTIDSAEISHFQTVNDSVSNCDSTVHSGCCESNHSSQAFGSEAKSGSLNKSEEGDKNAATVCTPKGFGEQNSNSQQLCDRCTQTQHSAINNSHSSKIHHHHHHHHHYSRHHSNPPAVSTVSPSVPLSGTNSQNDCHVCDMTVQSVIGLASISSSHPKTSEITLRNCDSSKRVRTGHSKGTSLKQKRAKPCRKRSCEVRLKQYEDNWSSSSSSNEEDCGDGSAKKSASVTAVASGSKGCEGITSASDCELDEESCGSSDTSSYNSECHDDEEIALAVQAAELASRNQARARFRSSSDMIHRLFVCISGVADQLQTNFAGDLRNILRVIFNLHCSEPVVTEEEKFFCRQRRPNSFRLSQSRTSIQSSTPRDPPPWIPDDQSTVCMSCKTPFTFVRRRHHCRNCGKIFCGRCSSNAASLPHFGHSKPVRVCNRCFMFQVTPFTMQAHV